jgi:hypothetical protein
MKTLLNVVLPKLAATMLFSYLASNVVFNEVEFFSYINVLLTALLFLLVIFFMLIYTTVYSVTSSNSDSALLEVFVTVGSLVILFFVISPSLLLLFETDRTVNINTLVLISGFQWSWESSVKITTTNNIYLSNNGDIELDKLGSENVIENQEELRNKAIKEFNYYYKDVIVEVIYDENGNVIGIKVTRTKRDGSTEVKVITEEQFLKCYKDWTTSSDKNKNDFIDRVVYGTFGGGIVVSAARGHELFENIDLS